MGLDMYLRAKRYVSNFDFRPDDKELNQKIRESLGLNHLNDSDGLEVSVTVGYWRKANQVHQWFVDNVQRGEDDCKSYWVQKSKMKELLDLCKEVLETKNADLLPPQSGFFFGSTEVDEFYWSDIEHTIKTLESVLNDESLKEYDFEYQSSW